MHILFRVESVAWERVTLTFHLRLGRSSTDGSWEPIVPSPRADPTWTPEFNPTDPQPLDLEEAVQLENVEEGPGGAEGDDAVGEAAAALAESAGAAASPETTGPLPELITIFFRDTRSSFPLAWQHLGDGRYRVVVNISKFNRRAFLPSGTWKFFAALDDGAEVGADWDLDRLDELDALTRVFLFSGNKQAYTVSFGLTENDVDPLFAVRAYAFVRKPGAKARKSRSPVKRLKRGVKKLVSLGRKQMVAQEIYDAVVQEDRASRVLRSAKGEAHRPRVLFASEMRTGLEGNLLAVRDRMLERGLDEQLDLHYSFRTTQTATSTSYLTMLHELARADIVLIDDYFPPFEKLKLKPDTRIIQVWHAGSGFKSVGYSRFGKFGSPGLTNAHRRYTYAITASTHLKHVYAEVFGIEEEAVIPTGLPRIDTFLDPVQQELSRAAVHSAFPQLEGKRVILFAPTFRGRGASQAHYNYEQIDFQALYDLCGDDTVVAFRMHHFVPEPVPIPDEMRDRFIDVADYRNGNDLLLVTDLLVTDYSSIIFEFSLLDRPMLFFAYDEKVYSAVRGFHRPYRETAPGKVCNTFDELVEAIRTEDFQLERTAAFRKENFDVIDTHSSDRVIDWLVLGDPPREAVEPAEDAAGTAEPVLSSSRSGGATTEPEEGHTR